jgi:glutamate-ammonia-ligase adenylyltransferase
MTQRSGNLGDNIRKAPAAFDSRAAAGLRESFGAAFAELTKDEQALLLGVADCSPYLAGLMRRAPERTVEILRRPPEESVRWACDCARRAGALDLPDAQMQGLRRAKDAAALAIALADIAGLWDVMAAARALSQFADAALGASLEAAARPDSPRGVAVIAMGKLGAMELNYSSDIDLIAVYDGDAAGAAEGAKAQRRAVNMTRKMIALLQMQTVDGYVFRTDMRLRPDPGVSLVAVSLSAAENYYEAFGENWERMAFIKSRAAAGDLALGDKFIQTLRPFVWRKHLDFAAIDDVRALKKQIHSAKGGAAVKFEGQDVKLGRGGIREIEFFVQAQQLILGGKNPDLRRRATLDALAALERLGHVAPADRAALEEAYRYLRHVEHRLQMIDDAQTHRIPTQPEALERLARFVGEESLEAFREKLLATLNCVRERYDDLYEKERPPSDADIQFAIADIDSAAETIASLERLGFRRTEEIVERVRKWRSGFVRATRSTRARQLLTTLLPTIFKALSKAASPDDSFIAFARFIESLPAGVQVFSLLENNPGLFDTLIRIMTASPYLARELSQRINFVEHLLETGAVETPPETSTYRSELKALSSNASSHEEALNIVRRWAGERKFLIAAQLAVESLQAGAAAAHFTAIAEACIDILTPAVSAEMRRQYGDVEGELVIVGLGRLGAGEMTVSSDMDLIFIYEGGAGVCSEGVKGLTPTEYFARLVRRLITALSAATEEGGLYEVDMQLRPSGAAGPAAVTFEAFRQYYEKDAWTWELMALTKARIVGPAGRLGAKIEAEIDAVLRRPRAREKVAQDVNDMRARLLQAKPAATPWDVKNAHGGLTDIAFICQFLALISASEYGRAPRAVRLAIDWFADHDELERNDRAALSAAHDVFDSILHAGRAATGGGGFDPANPASAGEALAGRMAAICGVRTIENAERALIAHQSQVVKIYEKIIGRLPDPGDGRL